MAGSKSRQVLLPVDGSEHAMRAFEWYRDQAKKEGDTLFLCHCVEPPPLNILSLKQPLSVPTAEWTNAINANLETVKKIEDKFVVECQRHKIKKFEFHMLNGNNPGEALCDFATDKNVDLIIIGNRGLGKVRRTFLGSVSDYIVHHIQVPITVVPPKK